MFAAADAGDDLCVLKSAMEYAAKAQIWVLLRRRLVVMPVSRACPVRRHMLTDGALQACIEGVQVPTIEDVVSEIDIITS